MPNKKVIINAFFICLIILFSRMLSASPKTILFLPFINEGNYQYDKLRTHIPNFLYEPIKDLTDYRVISYAKVNAYMAAQGIKETALKRTGTIMSLAEHFHADYMIHGYFTDEDDTITISFHIYRRIESDFETSHYLISLKLENTDFITLNASFDDIICIFKDIFGWVPELGHMTVDTSESCKLLIDGEAAGISPVRLALSPGDHTVTVIYESLEGDEVILDEKIRIEKNNSVEKNINIFVPLDIDAEEKCIVFINGKERGPTRFKENLFWGRVYGVKVVYFNESGEERIVFEQQVDTTNHVPTIYIPAKATLSLGFPDNFSARIGKESLITLPHSWELVPGSYNLRIFVDDPDWKRTWLFDERNISLSPFDQVRINRDVIAYKRNWSLLLLPSAMQFHNRQPVKAWMLLSAYCGTAVFTGVCAGLWWYHYGEIQEFNNGNTSGGNPYENYKNAKNSCILGLIALSVIHLYSAIDGTVTMNHLYAVINTK